MSGYLRAPSEDWEPEHYARAAWVGRAKSAPAWWIGMDIAWHVDRRKLPTAREAAEHWGVDKNKAARLIREGVTQQAAWEARADRKAATLRLLEEWASKEPKRATAANVGTGKGQGRDSHADNIGTVDADGQRIVAPGSGQERDAVGTGEGQGRDTSRTSSEDQPPTVQPPVDTDMPPSPGGQPVSPAPAVKPPDDGALLYAVQRGYHPRLPPTATPEARKAIGRILAECGDLDRAGLYLAWVHEAEDPYARQLRGLDPWPDGKPKARSDLESLSRHIAPRLADADAWEARGRTAPAQHRARDAPTAARSGRAMTIAELLAAPASDDEPPPRNPDAIDTAWSPA